MNEVVKLDAMQRAVAEAASIEEVMEIRDKAFGMAEYLQVVREATSRLEKGESPEEIARSFEAEKAVTVVRLRAERRIGEALRKLDLKVRPGAGGKRGGSTEVERPVPTWYNQLSKNQRSWWQQIALIPEKKFEEYLADPKKGALESSKRTESGLPTIKGFVKLALPWKLQEQEENRKKRPEKKLSADQLANIEEKRRLAAIKDQQRRVMQAHARSEQSSQRLVNRTFLLVKKMTSDERKSLLQMLEDRADELIEDSTWAAAS
jgi:hypothetical protein